MGTKPTPVMGIDAPGPKVTPRAIWLALRYVGLPLMAALVTLDVAIWLLVEAIWDVCIGLWCWI